MKNWAVKFNQDKDSTEDNPRKEFKTSTSKEEALAFIVWLRMKDSYSCLTHAIIIFFFAGISSGSFHITLTDVLGISKLSAR